MSYTLATPVDGTYTVVYTGDGDRCFRPGDCRRRRHRTYNDVSGRSRRSSISRLAKILLTFTAQAKADLAFLVGIEAGTMSEDSGEPGGTFNGGVFATSDG